jgi:hypothetical protein
MMKTTCTHLPERVCFVHSPYASRRGRVEDEASGGCCERGGETKKIVVSGGWKCVWMSLRHSSVRLESASIVGPRRKIRITTQVLRFMNEIFKFETFVQLSNRVSAKTCTHMSTLRRCSPGHPNKFVAHSRYWPMIARGPGPRMKWTNTTSQTDVLGRDISRPSQHLAVARDACLSPIDLVSLFANGSLSQFTSSAGSTHKSAVPESWEFTMSIEKTRESFGATITELRMRQGYD